MIDRRANEYVEGAQRERALWNEALRLVVDEIDRPELLAREGHDHGTPGRYLDHIRAQIVLLGEAADALRGVERERRHPGVTYLRHYGEAQTRTCPHGVVHTFLLRIEESSGDLMLAGSEGDFEMPWLRAMCSCGWASERRFTVDDNALWDWRRSHDEEARDG